MKIQIIKCLQDNYSYLIIDETNLNACVVDPSEARPIIDANGNIFAGTGLGNQNIGKIKLVNFENKQNGFTPIADSEKWDKIFKAHDSSWDVLADVLRLQAIVRAENDLEQI